MNNFTEVLVDKVTSSKVEDVAQPVMEAAKINIADTIVCGLLGAQAPGIPALIDWVRSLNTSGSSAVWSHQWNVPPSLAALCNASMAHALDFDDTHDDAVLHAGVGAIPAALAVAQQKGGVSGPELIRATIWGVETNSLLGLATPEGPSQSGWMLTSLYSYFSSVIASGCILALDRRLLTDALGIAFSMSAGNAICTDYGALTKRMQPGFGNQSGVMAVELALRGVNGPVEIFAAPKGLFQMYHRIALPDDYGERIGNPYQITRLSYKPYPCCRFNHTAIDAAIALHHEIRDKYEDLNDSIREVKVYTSEQAYNAVCDPIERKWKPQTVVDAQFSIPYTVATALLKGSVTPADFEEGAYLHGKPLQVSPKVKPEKVKSDNERHISGSKVVLIMQDGARYEKEAPLPSGQPGDTDGLWQLVWKKLQGTQVTDKEALFRLLKEMDQLDDVSALFNHIG